VKLRMPGSKEWLASAGARREPDAARLYRRSYLGLEDRHHRTARTTSADAAQSAKFYEVTRQIVAHPGTSGRLQLGDFLEGWHALSAAHRAQMNEGGGEGGELQRRKPRGARKGELIEFFRAKGIEITVPDRCSGTRSGRPCKEAYLIVRVTRRSGRAELLERINAVKIGDGPRLSRKGGLSPVFLGRWADLTGAGIFAVLSSPSSCRWCAASYSAHPPRGPRSSPRSPFVWVIFWGTAFAVSAFRARPRVDFVVPRFAPAVQRSLYALGLAALGGCFLWALPGIADYLRFMMRERTPVLDWPYGVVYSVFSRRRGDGGAALPRRHRPP